MSITFTIAIKSDTAGTWVSTQDASSCQSYPAWVKLMPVSWRPLAALQRVDVDAATKPREATADNISTERWRWLPVEGGSENTRHRLTLSRKMALSFPAEWGNEGEQAFDSKQVSITENKKRV